MPKFEVSGNAGGIGTTFIVSPNSGVGLQKVAVDVEPGQTLTLKNARFCFNDTNLRLIVLSTSSSFAFNSGINCGEVNPNFLLFTNTGTSTVTEQISISAANNSQNPATTLWNDGWTVKFKIA